ncbi:MAG: Elongation factor 4 [candidate division Kazan bacterium GW2011_GWA1_44_22]|uniref:Elongation factor 4 n=2 Tax=Bacteria division Kazan-3B-28 TaxID=1798534 RepID=A0A0G1HZS3_UNCK3|nr:MAG: Elongation factor 4 [candidate division Kazan bacterium GW2011_GWA1_44_22]
MNKIRNFCIIAHIDHGKSTLADRLLEITGTIEKRKMKEQLLDTMDLERERGITIKLQPVRMNYKGYELNLIDTPGHVDFSYEVSRSLAAVEGAILLVDATQGVEAQTLANLYLAKELNLKIIPAVNKIDLPGANVEQTKRELANILGVEISDVIGVSGKTGENVALLLDQVIAEVPAPTGNEKGNLRALVFDSVFDKYKGVIAYVRVVDGQIKAEEIIKLMAANATSEVLEVGIFIPQLQKTNQLNTGEIGYIATGLREVSKVGVGDTITKMNNGEKMEPLPGYKKVMPFVYAGIFTANNADYPKLRDALGKLSLSDAALVYEPENSPALGFGFRCGFLGLLHLDIVQERLEREFGINLVATTPSVNYELTFANGDKKIINNPTELPEVNRFTTIAEPWIKLEVLTPSKFMGGIMQLLQDRRGAQQDIKHFDNDKVLLIYEIPLSSIVIDFYDALKSTSSGYASMNYEFLSFHEADLVRLDILVGGNLVDVLSVIVHRSQAAGMGKKLVAKLKELIPRQNFEVTLQAALGSKIIAREDIPPLRKDVLAKLYGGDRTRKDKLLEKQKKGKKRMKKVGKVEIPQEAFLKLLS